MNLVLDDFKRYSAQIVIEIIPAKEIPYKSTFICKCGPESAYHIYFNESTKEMERNYLLKNEKVEKIKVKIDIKEEIKSLEGLFEYCRYNEEIRFVKFNRRDFINMNNIFKDCEPLIRLDISKLKTDSVTSMKYMFQGCSSLTALDISNFKTDNVIYINYIFSDCVKLKELNISLNFKTDNVQEMNSVLL